VKLYYRPINHINIMKAYW